MDDLTNARRPALIDDSLDLRDRGAHLVLTLRFQRNRAAELSGNPVAILETIQVVPVARVPEATAVARDVLQSFWRVFGGLVRSLRLRFLKCCRI